MRKSDAFLYPRGSQNSFSPRMLELSSGVRIRPFSPDDLNAILEIQHACKTIAAWRPQDYATLAGDPMGMILVAESEDRMLPEILGFSALYRVDAEAELWNLAVAPAHRRKGIARALLQEACRRLFEAGVQKLFLEVRESNLPALELYKYLGFQQLESRKDYYHHPREDALVLVLRLDHCEA